MLDETSISFFKNKKQQEVAFQKYLTRQVLAFKKEAATASIRFSKEKKQVKAFQKEETASITFSSSSSSKVRVVIFFRL